MTEETLVTLEVDGQTLQAKTGAMLIDVTDAAGIKVPRFCYHQKLSVSANCRMCLVEVERAPKPMPACATPVTNGMKVHTRSPLALAAQKGTMEFLLINHPLDCPICDQGGECELQDMAMGYGADVSRYVEAKRVVKDPDLGPLVATDMTRCIHCTRCVRFGAEIAGIREMGATGRGEHMKIGTYVARTVDSELSGNIIDLCPVGALTSRPFRFRARAWELTEYPGIAPHDCVGSNLALHVRRNQVLRVAPRDNEAVNECWISDRDRFSYEALTSDARLERPLVKENGNWREIGWEQALERAASMLKTAGERLDVLVSPSATLEELYLAQKLGRGLGGNRIDHRLRQRDFRNDKSQGLRWLGMPITDLERLDAVLVVGGNPRKDQPLLGHRLRKATLAGAAIHYLNPCRFDLNYVAGQQVCGPSAMVRRLAGVAKALGVSGPLVAGASDDSSIQATAAALRVGKRAAVLLGTQATSHPDLAVLESLVQAIAEAAGARWGHLQAAANSLGAQLAGAQPNLLPGGRPNPAPGAQVAEMLSGASAGALLVGLDPLLDCQDPGAARAALTSGPVVALSAFRTPGLEALADLLLPVGWFAETSGTYVNTQGDWQSVSGAVTPPGAARPAWKVLRVLGNLTNLEGFDFASSEEVLAEVRRACAGVELSNGLADGCTEVRFKEGGITRVGYFPIHAADMALRHAGALQRTEDARRERGVRLNGATAQALGLKAGDNAVVKQAARHVTLPVMVDEGLADQCALIPAGLVGTEDLGPLFGELAIEKE